MLQQLTGNRSGALLIAVTWLATAVACGPTTAPTLDTPGDQVAQVGTELVVNLSAMDTSGIPLVFTFAADDLRDLTDNAQIATDRNGGGVFRWTPVGADVGMHTINFTVSNGSRDATASMNVDVQSAVNAAGAPVFTAPSGTGQTLDLSKATCLDLAITVQASSQTMRITQDDPVIAGAMLTAGSDPLSATWHWCPTRAQQAEQRYMLVLDANDGTDPKTIKNYLIVLSGGSSGTGTSCPGTPPVISHTPMNVSSIADLAITATVTDDKGIKNAPLLYYSTTMPATPVDLTKLTQVTTTRSSGTPTNGVYAASVPNPVARMPAGAMQTLYYVFVATDDDDPTGTCDHTTTSQVYSMTVTSTATASQPICSACTADAQCGTGNECVRIGAAEDTYCLQACTGGCPTGYTCSTTALPSIDGAMAPQCVPDSGSCTMSTTQCIDDSWEVNDSLTDAMTNPVMAPDSYNLISCPSTTDDFLANDDWYRIVVPADQLVTLNLTGDESTDLDLHLYHDDGTPITASTGFDDNEQIMQCLSAATYYVKVNGFGSARNQYTLTYTAAAQSCTQTCVDDTNEPDDNMAQARATTAPTFTSTGNEICPDNDDWYHVVLFTDDDMTVDLAFTQSNDSQDLDLHLYQDGTDLTPCSVDDPLDCSPDNGQGGVSNEHTEFFAPEGCDDGCDYDVVVRGFDHSSNAYGITITID